MKKCPTCDKTFEDSMRFCQVDGTPLVDDAPAFDPYATIVAPAMPVPPTEPKPAAEEEFTSSKRSEGDGEPAVHATVGSIPIAEPDDVLDLPSDDPLKTMYVSDAEMRDALSKEGSENDLIEIPPIETAAPEPPSFLNPEPPAQSAPPSPFSAPESAQPEEASSSPFSSPEPEPEPPSSTPWGSAPEPQPASSSPWESSPEPEPKVEAPASTPFGQPEPSRYDEAATMIQPSFQSPFEQQEQSPAPVAEWNPPPAPEASWQNQEIGSNTPFQPPPAGAGGQNKTLAIVSLVIGIVSILCCSGFFLPGLAAIVTGVMARGKASGNPAEYGGAGLALGGIITGVISIIFGAIYWLLVFLQIVAMPGS